MQNKVSAISRAITIYGGQSALARALEVTPQAVQKWESSGRVPPSRVIDIENAVDGAVTRHELRPDIYPEETAIGGR